MSTTRKELLSISMMRTRDWIFSMETPSNLTIKVGGTSFSLHKFPLLSKCGYIRRLISEAPDLPTKEISGIPGGAEGFDYAAKFCYGEDLKMSTENIGLLRCVAEFLEMTEDHAVNNLVSVTEAYVNGEGLKSLSRAINILHSCEKFLQTAEKVKLVSRCIDTIAFFTCRDSIFKPPIKDQNGYLWAEDLTILSFDLFQRVLIAMITRGFKQSSLAPVLMLFAQKSLQGLEIYSKVRKKMEPGEEEEKRVILETIVSLLPSEKNTLSVSSLSLLLKSAVYLDTTVSCRLGLEKRIAKQLEQAVLSDLMIPSYSFGITTAFDIDTVKRIMTSFLEHQDENRVPRSQKDMEVVTKLMENYLAEIASDPNLSVLEFLTISELIPQEFRATEDGMYKAIDVYLKAHPALSDMERQKVCGVMDFQKLSIEACAHAAQNNRLPIQVVVQVLRYDQNRQNDAVVGGSVCHSEPPAPLARVASDPSDDYPFNDGGSSQLKIENHDLKMELMKMEMQLSEIACKNSDKPPVSNSYSPTASTVATTSATGKPPLPSKKPFMSGAWLKVFPLLRTDVIWKPPPRGCKTRPPAKGRRHSIS